MPRYLELEGGITKGLRKTEDGCCVCQNHILGCAESVLIKSALIAVFVIHD